MTRYIGIAQFQRMLRVTVRPSHEFRTYVLTRKIDREDWLLGSTPTEWSELEDDEGVALFDEMTCPEGYKPHHCIWRKLTKHEQSRDYPIGRVRQVPRPKGRKHMMLLTHIPISFDGLKPQDLAVVRASGNFTRRAAQRAARIGAEVYRIPSPTLEKLRQAYDAAPGDMHILMSVLLENAFGPEQLNRDIFIRVEP